MTNFAEEIKANGFKIEKREWSNMDKEKLSDFLLQNKMVLFFDVENDYPLRNFLDYCYDEDVTAYSKYDVSYILLHRKKLDNTIKEMVEYSVPHMKSINLNAELQFLTSSLSEYKKGDGYTDFSNSYQNLYQTILTNNRYDGSIKTGFIFKYFGDLFVIGCNYQNFFSNPRTPLELIVNYITFEESNILSSRHNFERKAIIYDELDDETKVKVKEIEQKFKDLKDNGQFLLLLPILKKLMNQYTEELNLDSISKIFIDSEYRITLPYFNNMEVKMSNLTKAIYLLFYENPKGIDLYELPNYRNQLQKLYYEISTFENLDKMNRSIDDVLNINTKAIYTHISRVKAAFLTLMDYEIAKNYIISSAYHGDSFRFIPIIKPQDENPFDGSDNDLSDLDLFG